MDGKLDKLMSLALAFFKPVLKAQKQF